MAPGYRNTTRRTGRGHAADHDIYEGLPVRQWRRDTVYVAPPTAQDGLENAQDKWDVELPWGMPKDSNLLPQHAQDLVRAARSGRIYKRPAPIDEDGDDAEGLMGEKPEKKEDTTKDRGFAAKAWKQVPRHLEGPDMDYLAKRRKGLQTPAQNSSGSGTQDAVPMTRTTVRRTDAAGNVYQEVIVVPQGQHVDGEIVKQVPVVNPNAAPVNTAAAPPARIINKKPPMLKGKRKGPGRGRKKKLLPPISVPDPAQAPANDAVKDEQIREATGTVQGSKINLKTENSANENTEMADYSQHNSEDEGDDGDDGEEGEIIESDDEQDGSVDGETSTPTPAPENSSRAVKSVPNPPSIRGVRSARLLAIVGDVDARGSSDVQAARASALRKEGSPLKVVSAIKVEKGQDVEEEPVESDHRTKKTEVESTAPARTALEQPQSIPAATKATESEQATKPTSSTPETEKAALETAAEPESKTSTATPVRAVEDNPGSDSTDKMDLDEDEMLLDTIDSTNQQPNEAEGPDDGRKGEEGASGEMQAAREDSGFSDMMGSLVRRLDSHSGGGAGAGGK